jgi:anaerobic magnesium-protoporphyrin IX monomethyl ester cyclase
MNSVLIANAYFYKLDAKQWRFKQPYPPLGTITAAAVLREAGFNVSLFDTNLRDDPDEIIPLLENIKSGYLVIYDDGFNYLTKMCLTVMREAAFRMAGCAPAWQLTHSTPARTT